MTHPSRAYFAHFDCTRCRLLQARSRLGGFYTAATDKIVETAFDISADKIDEIVSRALAAGYIETVEHEGVDSVFGKLVTQKISPTSFIAYRTVLNWSTGYAGVRFELMAPGKRAASNA